MQSCNRPILIYGAGIHLSGAEQQAIDFAHMTGIPVAPTWAGLDLIPSDDPLVIGSFGTHGTRAGNFAVQNADFILSVGSRLDSKATGTPIESFAREAHISMVDIDRAEIDKFKGRVVGICKDVKEFFLNTNMWNLPGKQSSWASWRIQIEAWKARYPVVKPEYYEEDTVNPYVFINELSNQTPEDTIICTDTGCAVAWVSQAWRWKRGQRFIHAFNQTPMGYGLPASLGAYLATGRMVVLVSGDGSLMMSLGELATIKDMPIKIFMFNNLGHAMCRQTQREWMGGTYPSTSIEGGLKFPQDFGDLALSGFGIFRSYIDCSDKSKPKHANTMAEVIEEALKGDNPYFVEVKVSQDADVHPKCLFGKPNEDMYPYLSRNEFMENMIIAPYGEQSVQSNKKQITPG